MQELKIGKYQYQTQGVTCTHTVKRIGEKFAIVTVETTDLDGEFSRKEIVNYPVEKLREAIQDAKYSPLNVKKNG